MEHLYPIPLEDLRDTWRQERRARYRHGLWAEFFASVYLLMKGYRVLARRYKTRVGEIDLVAIRGGVVAFVEVKARRSFEAAEFSISPKQSRRIRRAAERWIERNPRYCEAEQRFDALYVLPRRLPVHMPGCA